MTEQYVTNPSGLKYLDLQTGSGDVARPGQQAEVHYTGLRTTGQKFDSSVDRRANAELIFEVELLGLR